MAPCSVGILIDSNKIWAQQSTSLSNSPYNVAVIFLGGNDDWEALAYAKRMSRSMTLVQVTVFCLVALEDAGSNQWDTILDIEVLKDLRLMCMNQGNLDYKDKKVKEGPGTALIVNELKEEYDLIIVGRHLREDSPLETGLMEWSKLQELGPIGDILASEEMRRPIFVLVVQQQLVKK